MANETNWNISDFWKNRQRYTVLEIAYIACNEEPKEIDISYRNPMQKLISSVNEVERYLELKARANNPIPGLPQDYGLCSGNETSLPEEGRLNRQVSRETSIEIVNSMGVANFLAEPEQSTTPVIETDTGIKDFERNKYLKQIAALALVLAKQSNKYKNGNKPNASQIANAVQELLDAEDFQGKSGTGTTEIRDSISKGLNLLNE